MKCPCKNCLVYVRCKQKVKKLTTYDKELYYVFDDLIRECVDLRIFFGVNSILHKINMKSYYNYTLTQYLIKKPRGKQLIEEFLTVMGYHELPNILNPIIRIKPGEQK